MQAQVSDIEQVSKEESIVLIKNMIRISISSICYYRSLFPKEIFKSKPYGSIDIHQLQGAIQATDGSYEIINREAFLLTQWLEKGVFQALELEYVKTILFAIYTNNQEEKDLLLESYEFKVSYQKDGNIAKLNGAKVNSKEEVKYQAAKLIRSLTAFTETLDKLPSDRWITIQIQYYENTPEDYEPEYFMKSFDYILSNCTMPVNVKIGSLSSSHLELKINYCGLDNLLFEDIPESYHNVIQKEKVELSQPTKTPGRAEENNDDNKEKTIQKSPNISKEPLLDQLRNLVVSSKKVPTFTMLKNYFPVQDFNDVKHSLNKLEEEKIIEKRGFRYYFKKDQEGETIEESINNNNNNIETITVQQPESFERVNVIPQNGEILSQQSSKFFKVRKSSIIQDPITFGNIKRRKL